MSKINLKADAATAKTTATKKLRIWDKDLAILSNRQEMKDWFMFEARDYLKSKKCFNFLVVKVNGKQFALGIMTWGRNILEAGISIFTYGLKETDADCEEIVNIWKECVDKAYNEYIGEGDININYIKANSENEAYDTVLTEIVAMHVANYKKN